MNTKTSRPPAHRKRRDERGTARFFANWPLKALTGPPAQLPGIVDDLLGHSPVYNVNGKPMSSTNQGGSVVNGVNQHPNTTVPH